MIFHFVSRSPIMAVCSFTHDKGIVKCNCRRGYKCQLHFFYKDGTSLRHLNWDFYFCQFQLKTRVNGMYWCRCLYDNLRRNDTGGDICECLPQRWSASSCCASCILEGKNIPEGGYFSYNCNSSCHFSELKENGCFGLEFTLFYVSMSDDLRNWPFPCVEFHQ